MSREREVALSGREAVVTTRAGAGSEQRGRTARALREVVLRFAMIIVLAAVVVTASVITPGFLELGNIKNILTQNAPVGLVAIGMTFVIIAGGFDLSVSAIFALGAVIAADFASRVALPLAFGGAVTAGAVAGLINALVITRLNVNAFVATLGSASVFTGFAILSSNSRPIVPEAAGFDALGRGTIAGIPASIVILAVAFALGWALLARTTYGRALYAVGGNPEAARLAGLRLDTLRGSTYVTTGALAALGGAIIASETGVAQADLGASVTLDAIAIVIIGGTSLYGGEGAMWRTLVGLLMLATINNVFDFLNLDTAAQSLAKGALVIGAVALDSFTRSRRA
jgi:ribose transport system permease protein